MGVAVGSGIFVTLGNAIGMTGRSILPITVICVFYIIIPKKYPEQFAKRSIKIPVWAFRACSVLGGICALIIAVTLFKDLTSTDAAVAAAIVIIPLIFSAIALKTHSVDSSVLGKRRQEIVDSALKADE